MGTNQPISLVIREHDFQEAKNALKKYTEQAREEVELSRVPTDGGLFNLGDHKVTGFELNRITSQIQDYFISLNNLSQGLVEEFGQVYKAFEHLDKDYIAGIVASIKAAEEVSKQEQKDRKDIKELVGQHEQSVTVLKKFKQDIDKLKHLTDIDKAWELIETQTRLSREFADYIAGLSKLKHLKDVDAIYSDFERLKKEFAEVAEAQSKYAAELKNVREYCDMLSKIQHIKDIDALWNSNEALANDVQSIKETLEGHKKTISDFQGVLQNMQETQQQFVETINKFIADFRQDIDNQMKSFTEAQAASLNDIEHNYISAIKKLSLEQKEKLAFIEKAHDEMLDTIAKEQSAKLTEISEAFEAERAALNETVGILTQKVKLSYCVAGGAVVLTIVQLFLNILGVI